LKNRTIIPGLRRLCSKAQGQRCRR